MVYRVRRVKADLEQLEGFYNIKISRTRRNRLREFYQTELAELDDLDFDNGLDQEGKVDYVQLRSFLERGLQQLIFHAIKDGKMDPLLGDFASLVIGLCEDRQMMKPVEPQKAASTVQIIDKATFTLIEKIQTSRSDNPIVTDRSIALRAAKSTAQLRSHLAEWFNFFKDYDPLFTWWVTEPYTTANANLEKLVSTIREYLVGVTPDDHTAIVGQPVGRSTLLAELAYEKISYTPDELISIGEREYEWCLAEMRKASRDLGYDDWRAALEHVKEQYVPPGQQTQLVRDLAAEAIEYVKKHELVSVPRVAEETWRMFMLSPQAQRVSPFFLGGRDIQVSYPTSGMEHEEKLMSMRGNNKHFSRATVFHELIPGHRLQTFISHRHSPHRTLFQTSFYTEGWALYWELLLWSRHFFSSSHEDRIGTLFWRMHRCARIVFSLKFHLGQMSAQECVEYLVEKVGHERSTAEGEVRRSFNGEWGALYQVGYLIGGLQIWALRAELGVGEEGGMGEREFHDRVLREGEMPIELLRALMVEDVRLWRKYGARWRFYDLAEPELRTGANIQR
ncbi:MAG: hypothetical protein Q9227_004644 [Pyrenula ochraceoflavens]